MKFALGLIFFVIGLLLAIYFKKIHIAINLPIGWAERYLGNTAYAYFLFGMVGIVIGILMMFNFIDLGFLGI